MIVKVQLSLDSNVPGSKPGSRMLVYNKDRSIQFTRDADGCIVGKMLGRPKVFFYATNEDKGNGAGQLKIGGEAPWQDW